ncbi:MAG: flagellar hook-length control protein FliK [Emcibacteraceae bacterium]
MTTSVEILLKELPPASQAGDRIRRPDASSVGTSNAKERTSEISNNSDGKYEKSFSDHLDDHAVKKEKTSVSKTESRSENQSVDKKIIKDKEPSNEAEQSTEKTFVASEKTDVKNKDEQKQFIDEEKIEQVAAPQVDVIKADQKTVNETNENILNAGNTAGETVQVTHNLGETSLSPEELANDSNEAINENVQENVETGQETKSSANSTIPASTGTVNPERSERNESKPEEKLPEISENNQKKNPNGPDSNVVSNHAKTQVDKTAGEDYAQNSDLKSSQNEFSDFVHNTQNEQKEIRTQNTEAGKKSDENNTSAPDSILPQEAGTIISDAAKSNHENSTEANVNSEQPVLNNKDESSHAELLPQAAVQNAKNDQTLSPSRKIEEDSLSSVRGKKSAQIPANTAASISKENQNITTASTTQNAAKSDIQLDLGTNGQKFETLLPQNNPLNGQPLIANGGLLIAQQVHTQNAATHQIGILKADNPAMTRMINEQITVAINRNIGGGHHNFSIRLHPVELGLVDVKVEFMADGKMHASMMVESEKTLSMLQRDQHSLGRALQDAGINLSQKEMSFSLMKQSQEQNSQQFTSSGRHFSEPMKSEEFMQVDLPQYVSLGYSNQAIDISV